MTGHDIVCVHTIVGYAPAHAAHFSTWADGRIGQSRDTAYRSAANLYGNARVIAIENEDLGPAFGPWSGSDVPPLTDAQVIANGRILAWAHNEHRIPMRLCPDSRPGSRGLAYHRQGIDGNFTDGYRGRVTGGEVWTEHFGKVCPGRNRIAQLPDILDAAHTIHRGGSLTLEDDMPYTDWPKKDRDALVADVAAAVLAAKVTNKAADGHVQGEVSVSSILTNLERSQDLRFQQLKDLIQEALTSKGAGSGAADGA
jgi:hypothetical protein